MKCGEENLLVALTTECCGAFLQEVVSTECPNGADINAWRAPLSGWLGDVTSRERDHRGAPRWAAVATDIYNVTVRRSMTW